MSESQHVSLRVLAGLGIGLGVVGYFAAFRDVESDDMKELRRREETQLLEALDSALEAAKEKSWPSVETLAGNLHRAMRVGLTRRDSDTVERACRLLEDAAEHRLQRDAATVSAETAPSSELVARLQDSLEVAHSLKHIYPRYPLTSYVLCWSRPTVIVNPVLLQSAAVVLADAASSRQRDGMSEIFRLARRAMPGYLVAVVLGFVHTQVDQQVMAMLPDLINYADEGEKSLDQQVLHIVYTYCVSRACDIVSQSINRMVTLSFHTSLYTRLMQCCLGQDMAFFDRQPDRLADRIEEDIQQAKQCLFDAPIDTICSITQVVGATRSIYLASPRLFLPCLLPLPFAFAIGSVLFVMLNDEEQEMSVTMMDPLRRIQTVRAHVMEVDEGRKLEICSEERKRKHNRSKFFSSITTTLLTSVVGAQILGMYYYGCKMYRAGSLKASDLQSLTVSAITVLAAVPQLINSVVTGSDLMQPLRRLAVILDTQADIEPRNIQFRTIAAAGDEDDAAVAVTDDDAPTSIEFEDVFFRYPVRGDSQKAVRPDGADAVAEDGAAAAPGDKPPADCVLKGVSFKACGGQTVAIVGGVGSGKSTIIKLVERLYDATAGRVLVNGKPITEHNVHGLRSQMALVAQDSVLIGATIKEALAYGLRSDPTDDEVKAACESTGAWSFIEELKDGLHSRINCLGGVTLSGGQKQSLCVTRAVMRRPSIMLLDEATSSLDSVSEAMVQAGIDTVLDEKKARRITLCVAHRLQTIINSDAIVVLHEGRVVEVGTHDTLMQIPLEVNPASLQLTSGFYKRLYETQMRVSDLASPAAAPAGETAAAEAAEE
eukprot:Rhum_TRINITY_DN20756_c0_g1::Rhum_TRINITY_DN20756_c0_g1_i1::g.172044::m.172044